MASDEGDQNPEKNAGAPFTTRAEPNFGRNGIEPVLDAWVLAAARASLDENGVLSAFELVRTLRLPSIPVKVDLFLLYEIPFSVAPRGAVLRTQVERPTGEDAREYKPKDTRIRFDEDSKVARRVTRLAGVPIAEEGWHTIRIEETRGRVLAQTSILVVVLSLNA